MNRPEELGRVRWLATWLLMLMLVPTAVIADQVLLTIINETSGTVEFFWVDPQGQEQRYGDIPAGQQAVQPTWPTHKWRIRQGEQLWHYTVKQQPIRQEARIRTDGDGPATPPPPPPQTGFAEGRFLPCDAAPPNMLRGPARGTEGTANSELPHGNYQFPPVIRFEFTQGNAAMLSTTNSGYSILPTEQAIGAVFGTGENTVELLDLTTLSWRGKHWCAVEPYDHVEASGSDVYGGAFRPPPEMHQLMYYGWDLGAVDPQEIQLGGYRQKIFAYPGQSSTDYHRAELGGGFVPDGISLHAIDLGRSQETSLTHYSAASFASAWQVSLGASAEVVGLGGGGVDTSFAHSLQQMSARESVVGHSSVQNVMYTLLVDFPRVELSQAFQDRVLVLANQQRSGQQPDFEGLVRAFGTHYAAAMSFGGAVICESMYNHSDYSELQNNQISAGAHASLSLEGVLSVGGSVSGSYSWSPGFQERHGSQHRACRSTGGTLGSNGWQLSQERAQPVFADFRPIADLLNPVYFDDPMVWDLWAPYKNWSLQYYQRRQDIYRPSGAIPSWLQ